jgi:hypothetical protein
LSTVVHEIPKARSTYGSLVHRVAHTTKPWLV